MLFQTPIFFFFLALLLPAYAVARGDRPRQIVLLVFSYWFYAHWNWRYLSLLLTSSTIDWFAARMIFARDDSPRTRRLYLCVSMTLNLGLLAVFKYGRFFLRSLALDPFLQRHFGFDSSALPSEIPPGISFYTFQTMSYTIDVFLRRSKPEKDILDYALYVSFFPQLVAGPIMRAHEFLPQTHPMQPLRAEALARGLQRFTLGMFKKIVFADNVGMFVNAVFLTPGREDAVHLWAAAYGFALLIYCDFSAYTDMAIGIAQVFGFKLPENFEAPYLSHSITEFWRRWHMTLSRWLRDYLYIPLGGNHGGSAKTYRNLLLTMLLGGLWHGANWTFVLWGAWHGIVLAIERMLGVRADERATESSAWIRFIRVVVTFHLVVLAWVAFRSPSIDATWDYVTRMFTQWDLAQVREFGHQLVTGWAPSGPSAAAFWVKALILLTLGQWLERRFDLRRTLWDRLPWFAQSVALAAAWLVIAVSFVDEVKFIYFQF